MVLAGAGDLGVGLGRGSAALGMPRKRIRYRNGEIWKEESCQEARICRVMVKGAQQRRFDILVFFGRVFLGVL